MRELFEHNWFNTGHIFIMLSRRRLFAKKNVIIFLANALPLVLEIMKYETEARGTTSSEECKTREQWWKMCYAHVTSTLIIFVLYFLIVHRPNCRLQRQYFMTLSFA